MRFRYAPRRHTLYPESRDPWRLAPADYTPCFLDRVKSTRHPELGRSVFLRVPLPDGEIDYRFAVSAMREAGYAGYMAIEGAAAGDQFHADGKSLEYAKAVWAEVGRAGRRRGRR
jgi:hypothetical protein